MSFVMLTCTVGLLSGGWDLGWHQYTTSSHATTLESNKSDGHLFVHFPRDCIRPVAGSLDHLLCQVVYQWRCALAFSCAHPHGCTRAIHDTATPPRKGRRASPLTTPAPLHFAHTTCSWT